jgi:hypothetical protein
LNRSDFNFNQQRKTASIHVVQHGLHVHDAFIRIKMCQISPRMDVNLCYIHTQPDFEPGSFGIKTVPTRFNPFKRASHSVDYDTPEKKIGHAENFGCLESYRIAVNPSRPLLTSIERDENFVKSVG